MLVDRLIKEGWLRTPAIIEAFRQIKREDFLPPAEKSLAELDEALSIGYGQTISQPLVVAFMLELLQPAFGEKILDIGAGSGWTSALLAHIVSDEREERRDQKKKSIQQGRVIALEIVPQLCQFGRNNVAKYNFIKKGIVQFISADGSKGWEREAPYDKILCSACAEKLPEEWGRQLKEGGRIVLPIGSSLWLFIKRERGFETKEFPGFVFVPLVRGESAF